MADKNFVIAVDGFSSCGKSTVAKALAKHLNFVFIDSGAMYRAVTLYFLRNNVDFNDENQVVSALKNIQIDFVPNNEKTQILLNGEDVSDEIRQMHVSEKVSEVSAIKEVRHEMVAQQQQLGQRRNIVMDGRDIGTTVFPKADLKIFMTASPDVRAERRFAELKAKGEETTVEDVRANLAHRDHIDSTREESPLRQAKDAIVLDNSDLSQAEQLEFVLQEYYKRIK
ncbi:(d)CMP kinase [Sphingobacterium wenxiniae]|uniref:Cytidylate kinase n=1 Tax=Sphingobacterium wenxiniae TaxID=683125 RepID=A0A1I6P7C4_9SPHI|nr:(d)CMP kinase [Sphingobacterium wenxiniae]SFS36093.1 cytidylate kinase [Sphingobacterium wenxiniae]